MQTRDTGTHLHALRIATKAVSVSGTTNRTTSFESDTGEEISPRFRIRDTSNSYRYRKLRRTNDKIKFHF